MHVSRFMVRRAVAGMPDATVPRNSSAAHELLGAWDLGTRRTLQQLIDFTGVDTTRYEVTKSSCGKLVWVPFDEDEAIDDDSDPSVTAYELYSRRQAKEPPPAHQPPAGPEGQQGREGAGKTRHLAAQAAAAAKRDEEDMLHRTLLSLGLSFLALALLVVWWYEEKRVPSYIE